MTTTPTASNALAAIREAMPVIAYLRATRDRTPVWDGDDCVCQDSVYPSDPDGSDADCISMAMVRLEDAESALAAKDATIAQLEARVREAEADARRWRAARGELCNVVWVHIGAGACNSELDAAVDAALSHRDEEGRGC